MTNIFITGDRSMEPFAAVTLVQATLDDLIRQTHGDLAIGTGNAETGIERAVRYLLPERALNIAFYNIDEEGKVDCAPAFREIEPTTDLVVFLHMDPLSSRIGRAITSVFPTEKVRMPLQTAMVKGL